MVGDPLTPRTNIPARITDLAAVQRGAVIIAQFTVPALTTEGVAIKTPVKLDLRAGPGPEPFNREAWAAQAKPEEPKAVQNGLAAYQIPIDGWEGKEIVLGARAIGFNGKSAGWSPPVAVVVVAPPAKPLDVTPEATAGGVRLTWSSGTPSGAPPGVPSGVPNGPVDFRIFRRGPEDKGFGRIADTSQTTWTDTTAEFGKHYLYLVQRIVKLPDGKEAESDPSAEAAITPLDTFPPAVPTGLHASLAPASIEIAWEQNSEADLAGYRLYRAVGDGDFERIAEVSQIPSYSDHAVEAGKTYRYVVSAFDQSGNESARSAAVEARMQ